MLRSEMLALSRRKFVPPYTVDEELTFYCPQENVAALDVPTIAEWHRFLATDYAPPPSPVRPVLLLMPCTKTKPYAFSYEHRAINGHLLRQGFEPVAAGDCPQEALAFLEDGDDPALVNNTLLRRGNTVIHRMVVSEPMGLVPYELLYHYRGGLSPASRYDCPGLFEHRGNTVCHWRPDHTGRLVNGRWAWGPNERAAFATAHNRLVEIIARTLVRLRPHYSKILAYVSPKMTHRSFLAGAAEKRACGMRLMRRTSSGTVRLKGVNDLAPGLVIIVPGPEEIREAYDALATRLRAGRSRGDITPGIVRAFFATGGGKATPLVLPETLAVLDRHLGRP